MLWKVVIVILNRRFADLISFHNALYGFGVGHGTGTASLEEKLIQQLASMREEVLYTTFLYLHKVYDALDMYIFLEILKG